MLPAKLAEGSTIQKKHCYNWKGTNWFKEVTKFVLNIKRKSNQASPFVSEQCINLGVAPQPSPHSGHSHQLGEVHFVLGLPAEEPGTQQGRPFELQLLLAATLIWLQRRTQPSVVVVSPSRFTVPGFLFSTLWVLAERWFKPGVSNPFLLMGQIDKKYLQSWPHR